MKIALNVAAIGCRGQEEATLVSAYNNIIKAHAKVIKSTEKTVIGQLGKETGTNGTAARDRLSTQLFNYFAQPPAQRQFCPRANEIAQIVSTTPTAQVLEQAPTHLERLDQPFRDFYEAFAQYQADVAAWDAKYAPPPPAPVATDIAAPDSAPIAPPAPMAGSTQVPPAGGAPAAQPVGG